MSGFWGGEVFLMAAFENARANWSLPAAVGDSTPVHRIQKISCVKNYPPTEVRKNVDAPSARQFLANDALGCLRKCHIGQSVARGVVNGICGTYEPHSWIGCDGCMEWARSESPVEGRLWQFGACLS